MRAGGALEAVRAADGPRTIVHAGTRSWGRRIRILAVILFIIHSAVSALIVKADAAEPGSGGPAPSRTARANAAPNAAAGHRSPNFVIYAPTSELARKISARAEHCRRVLAIEWLGRELPNWSQPCQVRVKVTNGESGGETNFSFGRKGVVDQDMKVEGRIDRIMDSALPHEITHTILAHHYGGPLPRWADEGASLCSEDRFERDRYDKIARKLLMENRALPLSRLFTVESYPRNIFDFYGQGFSVSRFLIDVGGRPRFLKFLRDGETKGWDQAAKLHYQLPGVRELDRAWRAWIQTQDSALAARDLSPPDDRVIRAQSPAAPSSRAVRR